MSLLTFKRKDLQQNISVNDSLWSINRLLERTYPDCTYSVVATADSGKASEWVTIELEITRESLACADWYRKQAEARGLTLADWRAGQATAFEVDSTSTFLSPSIA